MTVIGIAYYKVKDGMRDALIREMKDCGVQDKYESIPGCLCFKFGVPLQDANRLILTNVFADEDAYRSHLVSEAQKEYWEPLKEKYIEYSDWKLYRGNEDMAYATEVRRGLS